MVRQRNRSIRAFSTGVLIYLICWIHTANHELQFMPSLFTFTPRVLPSPFDWPIMKTWIPAPFVIVNDQADVVHGTGAERRIYFLSLTGDKHIVSTLPIDFHYSWGGFLSENFNVEQQIEAARAYAEQRRVVPDQETAK